MADGTEQIRIWLGDIDEGVQIKNAGATVLIRDIERRLMGRSHGIGPTTGGSTWDGPSRAIGTSARDSGPCVIVKLSGRNYVGFGRRRRPHKARDEVGGRRCTAHVATLKAASCRRTKVVAIITCL